MEEKYKIHSLYILLILGSIIIGLITVKWAEIPNLVQYITFALTVSSLCLALLAIVYSVYSNTAFSQNISSLEHSTNILATTSTKLSIATEDLKCKVEDIPGIIKVVSEKVEETHALISDMSTRSSPESVNVELSDSIPEAVLSSFLTRSSYNGLLLFYIYSLSYKTETPFNYKSILEIAGLKEDYSFAYTVASSAVGLIEHEIKKDIWIIRNINKYISNNVSNMIDKRIEYFGGEDEELMNELKERKEKIVDHFSED